jgi:hypothetical protein
MKFAVSKLYIKNYFDKVARAEVLFIWVSMIILSFIFFIVNRNG